MQVTPPSLYLTLRVVSGTDAGRTVDIRSGQVVYLGRSPTLERTSTSERLPIVPEPSQVERVERFLAGRSPSKPDPDETPPGASRPKLENFQRLGDVKLIDATVSRVHALVFVEGDRAGVVDLASTNGTVVNGRKISAAPLQPGDVLELGNVRIEIGGLG